MGPRPRRSPPPAAADADASPVYVLSDMWQDGELDKIMAYFDVDGDGHISINEFIRGIRVTATSTHRHVDMTRIGFL